MRKKERRLVVTFHTAADAMEMEQACRQQNEPGRLIPLPREISAGCGLAWCAGPQHLEAIQAVMRKAGISQEDVCKCMV